MKDALPPLQLSERIKSIPEALSIYINQLVYDQVRKGKDIVSLSLGEAFFEIPMFDFSELDFVKGYHYSDSQGIPELRKVVSEFYLEQYKAKVCSDKEILITAGSKPVIFFCMQATLNVGDEILIHEPGWLSYQEQARLVGATPRFIPYTCPIDDFCHHFSEKTKMLVINNPNNPAGKVFKKEELESIYKQCRSKGIYVLVDEAYSDYVIDEEFHSMAKIVGDKEGILVVNSLSKNMGMSGWRVGYVIATPLLISNILKLNQHIITFAPTILQYYMARYFKEVTAITLPQVLEVVKKRQRVAMMMDELGIKRMEGTSTFYFLISIDPFEGTSLEFALHLLLIHQIAVVPGSAYGESTARYVRVGIGTESEERIYDSLLVINDLIHQKGFSSKKADACLVAEGFHRYAE
jgi:aspartate aminotransferase/aminotransferase